MGTCFDPGKLKRLEFSYGCVDAGVTLEGEMREGLEIVVPRRETDQRRVSGRARCVERSELRLLTLRRGRVMMREAEM